MRIRDNKISQLIEAYRPMALRLNREHKHVSVCLRRGQVISVGFNRRKTHPLAQKIGYLNDERHAELDALVQIPHPLRDGLALVNFRFNNQGILRMSKPCKLCLPWVVDAFETVYYSDRNGNVVRM